MSLIDGFRTWLEQFNSGTTHINYTDINADTYAVVDNPNTLIVKQYLRGSQRQKSFLIESVKAYGLDDLTNISASGFFDDLADWVTQMNREKNYPNFGTSKQVLKVEVQNTAYLSEADGVTAKYQIPIQVTYRDKEE